MLTKQLSYLIFGVLFSQNLIAQIPNYEIIDFLQSEDNVASQLSLLITSTYTYELDYTPKVWETRMITDLNPDDNSGQEVLYLYG